MRGIGVIAPPHTILLLGVSFRIVPPGFDEQLISRLDHALLLAAGAQRLYPARRARRDDYDILIFRLHPSDSGAFHVSDGHPCHRAALLAMLVKEFELFNWLGKSP